MADYNADQRVTNAVILHKLESMDKEWRNRFDDLDRRLSNTENRLDEVRLNAAPCGGRFNKLETEVDKLNSRVNAWNGLNSLGVMIAGLLGIFSK